VPIELEDFGAATQRITECAQAVVDRMSARELQEPRVDSVRAERALRRHFRVRGLPVRPLHWFDDGRSARAYIRTHEPREPRAAYWSHISIARALDAAWWAGAMRPPIESCMNVINATRDWDAWAATVDDFNREIDHNPDLVPPIKLLAPALPRPSDDDWCASIDRIMQSGCLRGTHPLWLWLPLVDAFAAGLYFYWAGRKEVVCISRPSLWIEDGQLHREGGPAVRWPTGEQYFFHRGVELSEGGDKEA
jgi:hypothetical protein